MLTGTREFAGRRDADFRNRRVPSTIFTHRPTSVFGTLIDSLLFTGGGRDGLYLVRQSESSEGDYALSVVHNGCVAHYQIRRNGDDAFFSVGDQGVVIHGLEELIRHYEDGRGLVSPLTEMCKGQPPPHDVRRHGRTNLLHRAIAGGKCLTRKSSDFGDLVISDLVFDRGSLGLRK